ncbi:MAG: hypothetical protein JRG91_02480 [Deltaproteobacteria bacterium]|nr:hypothetical protein [Deltaproteobacteria bacterium]
MKGPGDEDREPGGLRALRPAMARRLASLAEHEQLASVLRDVAAREGAGELVSLLAAALEDHREGRDALGGRILLAAMILLTRPGGDALGPSLRGEARARGLEGLAGFLDDPPPLFLDQARRVQILKGKDGRPLTLGERKSLARNPGRFEIDRLLQDPAPEVVVNLLASSRLTEIDVVRIAAKRPAVPEVLRVVARSKRWVMRYRVRLALVSNPYLEPSLGVKIAPLLLEQDRRRLAADHTLHPRLREFLSRSLRRGRDGHAEEILPDMDGLDEDLEPADT